MPSGYHAITYLKEKEKMINVVAKEEEKECKDMNP